MQSLLFVFFLVLFGVGARGEGLKLRDGQLYLETFGPTTRLGEVQILEKGTKLYHWASEEAVNRRSKSGRVEAAEMEAMASKDGGAQGGGLYTSLDPFDAAGFGSHLLVIELPEPLRYVQWSKLEAALAAYGGDKVKLNAALRALGISATLRGLSERPRFKYVCLFDSASVTKTHRAGYDEMLALFNQGKNKETEAEELFRLLKIANQGPLTEQAVHLDYRHFPIIKTLLSGKKPSAVQVKRMRRDPYFYRLQFLIVPGTRVQISDPSALALAMAEAFFNEEEIELFVIALQGTARARKRPLNLAAPTLVARFPRVAGAFAEALE